MEYTNFEFSVLLIGILFLLIIFNNLLDINRFIDTKIVNSNICEGLIF